MKTVSWFSAGISSAVATKMIINEIDEIFYIHIDDHHEDTLRFVDECEQWFGKKIVRMQSRYRTVEDACCGKAFLKSAYGAACTSLLKTRVRVEWEASQSEKLRYVWGFDCNEKERHDGRVGASPKYEHISPLADKSITKEHAHGIFKKSGIKRHEMYELGYHNANCVGCIKGGMGYWNKIRVDFPDVFNSRAKLERTIGHSCLKDDDGLIFLDELDPTRGRHETEIMEDCGLFCEFDSL
jgi:3'-phosphoadenosine 5'-phosphosulfate sulfotransferase (PAPS reductase)/FAD synthetase